MLAVPCNLCQVMTVSLLSMKSFYLDVTLATIIVCEHDVAACELSYEELCAHDAILVPLVSRHACLHLYIRLAPRGLHRNED